MNYFRRCGAVALSAVLLLSALGGCSKSETPDDTKAPGTSTTEPDTKPAITFDIEGMTDPILTLAGIDGNTVVATAQGVDITAAEYLYQVAYACDTILSEYAPYGITEIPWGETMEEESFADAISKDAIYTATLYGILPDIAKGLGLEVDQSEIDQLNAALDAMIANMGSEEIATYALWEAPITFEQYRASLLSQSYYGELYEHYAGEGGEYYVTDEECIAYAEEQGLYNVKHILIKTVSDTPNESGIGYASLSDDEIADKAALAEDLLSQLNASDEPLVLFDELMNEYSEDGRDSATGDLVAPDGYVAYPSQMVAEFEKAALALDDYEYSTLVSTEYGYHIILRLPLEMSDNYRTALTSESMKMLQDGWLEDSEITTTDVMEELDLQEFYENLIAFRGQMDEVIQGMLDEIEAAK